ncbi:MAG TPA: response regulator [Desulfobacterales bacterium]|nr:response regulator [Desulfobacterales bacterium]
MAPVILFVDDEENILKSLARLFIDEDYEVHTAISGREGLELINNGLRPAVIISDQRMPEMNGAEFLRRVRELLPDSIRLVLTGYADIKSAVEAINQGGVYRYILKPWDDEELRKTISEAVKLVALKDDNRRLNKELMTKNIQLEQINEHLEEKVRQRTAELESKVRELKGRDRVQRFLMTIHPLEELLHEILTVIIKVCIVNGAAFYILEDDVMQLKAAINFTEKEAGGLLPAQAAGNLIENNEEKVFLETDETLYCLLPVKKNDEALGVLAVVREAARPLNAAELHTLSIFCVQAAIGIKDCRLYDNYDDIESSLDNILNNLGA